MSELIVHGQQNSPFDGIRHLNENGNEFWYARELMPLLGYAKWQYFNKVVGVAIENLETVTESVSQHFLRLDVKSNGRPKLDYKLSRLAAYHVALCCDSRGNDAVKSAKHYFAIKTREAETVIPQQSDRIKELELELKLHEMRLKANTTERELIDLKVGLKQTDPVTYQVVVEKKPISEVVPMLPPSTVEIRTPESEDGISVTQLMGELGCFERTKSGQFKQKDREIVKQLLKEIGVDLSTGKGACKVEHIRANYAIPKHKVTDAKSRVLSVIKQIKPNLYESAMARMTN